MTVKSIDSPDNLDNGILNNVENIVETQLLFLVFSF